MSARAAAASFADRLPRPRGKLLREQPLAPLTWFRVGGPAEALFMPADIEDLSAVLEALPADIAVTLLGAGSNLLVRDRGVRGLVIRLSAAFAAITTESGSRIRAGAGALDVAVARHAEEASITGLEFLRGVPGTIGGAIVMNAGAYGRELKDVLIEARGLDRKGALHVVANHAMQYRYRESRPPASYIFVDALLQGAQGDRQAITKRMQEITQSREESQPIRARTSGSTFKNPDPQLSGGRRAWELIDAAGCRGLRIGDAQVSEQHCNFLVNLGEARAADLETLGETVRARVLEATGVALEWEVKRIGERGEM